MGNTEVRCPSCGSEGKKITDIGTDVYKCEKCGLEYVDKQEMFNLCEDANSVDGIDYVSGLTSLESIRVVNYYKILSKMNELRCGKYGLEIGCAYGLFLDAAKQAGLVMEGVEPMEDSYIIAKQKGHNVKHGFFPQDFDYKKSDNKYDFICFNDVFEHIPDINNLVETCKSCLISDGYMIINLPDENGILFKLSRIMNTIGDSTAHKRLWQIGTSSPHLYYFCGKSLDFLLERHSFKRVGSVRLKSFSLKGLWSRINAVPIGRFKAIVYFILLLLAMPIIMVMPADTKCYIYKRV